MTYIFYHIPKTAGSSLSVMANENGHSYKWISTEKGSCVEQAVSAINDGYDWIAGHFQYPLIQGEEITSVTILRHPADRLQSHYHYLQSIDEDANQIASVANAVDFSEFVLYNVYEQATRQLSGESWRGKIHNDHVNAERFNRAKNALNEIDIVGTQENFSDLVQRFRDTEGWELPERHEKQADRDRTMHKDVRKVLEIRNKYDLRLWEYAQEVGISES